MTTIKALMWLALALGIIGVVVTWLPIRDMKAPFLVKYRSY
jgi:hypothetical protein